MKRRNEFLVGGSVLIALAVVIGGAIWLSETDLRNRDVVHGVRFREVGGLKVGAPVTLRGVKVGRVNAIRLAAGKLKSYDLSGCEIYSTTEPCPMCFAAIHWARIGRLIYGTVIIEVAQLGFNELTLSSQQMQALGRSPVAIYPGFLADECRQLLAEWARMPGRQVY